MLTRFTRVIYLTSRLQRLVPISRLQYTSMDADDTDLSSLGFTSFGKKPTSHTSMPMHAAHNPASSSSLPPKPPPPQSAQAPGPPYQQPNPHYDGPNQGYNGRGRGRGGHGGGPMRSRGHQFHRGGGGRGGGGRGGRGGFKHHHPYSHPGGGADQSHQRREFSTSNESQQAPYRSKEFGEGLYKPSMNEDPWKQFGNAPGESAAGSSISGAAAAGGTTAAADIWMGENEVEDRSNWYDKEEDKAADGGGWNADEIDLGDDI